jgi:methylated-DNA-[protein]-cysteine S-methyltransferase
MTKSPVFHFCVFPTPAGRFSVAVDKSGAVAAAAFGGKRRDFSVGLSASGTPFQRKVWAALREIPYGETRTYGDVARTVRSSPRAVGRANATNPVCLIVPCHRVIGSDGSLTGYAFGERTKRSLLRLEGA